MVLFSSDPQNLDTCLKLSECYYHLNDVHKAEEYRKLAEELEPKNPYVRMIKANILMKQNQNLGLAYQLAEKAYFMKPEDPEIIQTFGNANLFIGKYPDGIALLEKALPNSKDKDSILFNLYIAYGHEKRFIESYKSSRALLRIHPSYNRFIRFLGAFLSLPFIRATTTLILIFSFFGFIYTFNRWFILIPFIYFSTVIIIGIEKIRKKEITRLVIFQFITYILFDTICAYFLFAG